MFYYSFVFLGAYSSVRGRQKSAQSSFFFLFSLFQKLETTFSNTHTPQSLQYSSSGTSGGISSVRGVAFIDILTFPPLTHNIDG